ncbi:MAG: hypothetical protein NT169_05700 [Chloroflexi bacterium]|nr:hypothetical protein [Chloroflexota bacterium]
MVCEVVAGNAADDPLYVPAVDRVLQIVDGLGLLFIRNCKMSALATRSHIAHQQHYLCPLALTGELCGAANRSGLPSGDMARRSRRRP